MKAVYQEKGTMYLVLPRTCTGRLAGRCNILTGNTKCHHSHNGNEWHHHDQQQQQLDSDSEWGTLKTGPTCIPVQNLKIGAKCAST